MPFAHLALYTSDSAFVVAPPASPQAPALVIDRPTGDLQLVPTRPRTKPEPIAALLGIIHLRFDKYLVVVTKSTVVGKLRNTPILKATATKVLPLREARVRDADDVALLALVESHLETAQLYFSPTLDLTNALQRATLMDAALPMWQRADDRFFWNRHISSDFIHLAATNPAINDYIQPVIYGLVSIRETSFAGRPVSLALVSRRCRFRAGTRFFTRGLDSQGNPANYNETEMVVVLRGGDDATLSYVQVRGSVPAFWAEINNLKYTPKIVQPRASEHAVAPATRHLAEAVQVYGGVTCVNLVNSGGREQRVKNLFEETVSNIGEKLPMHYFYFDYHKAKVPESLVHELEGDLQSQGYFRGGLGPGGVFEVVNRQTGVMRSNCMDCLDRTNVVQTMFARRALNHFFTEVAGLAPGTSFVTADPSFDFVFRNLWADNADAVSCAYSGTGAMKTDVTRTGKRTNLGKLNDGRIGVTRYVLNNFFDGPRQDGFDLFTGAYDPAAATGTYVTADRRPMTIQAVPYVSAFSLLMVILALISSHTMRLFTLFWFIIFAYTARFIITHGMLYVNWPKLQPQKWAVDGFSQHMNKAHKDPVLGMLVAHFDQGAGAARYAAAEEGKTRLE